MYSFLSNNKEDNTIGICTQGSRKEGNVSKFEHNESY